MRVDPSSSEVLDAEEVRRFSGLGLFIGGCAKSGTTLLLSLLDGHPQLVVFPEETFYLKQYDRTYARMASLRDRIAYLLECTHVRFLKRGFVERDRSVVSKDTRDYRHFDYPRFENLVGASIRRPWMDDAMMFSEVLRCYAVANGMRWETCVRWVEKSVCNEAYHAVMDRLFPLAKMIQMLRDPRAVYASRKKFLVTRYASYTKAHRLTREWNMCARQTPRLRKDPARFLVVRYEDLVTASEECIRAVCKFAGIDFFGNLLSPTRGGEAWKGNSAFTASFSGISTQAIDHWKGELDEHEIWWIELHCRKGMEIAGYPLQTPARFSLRRWLKRLPNESWEGYLRARRGSIAQWLGLLKDCRYS